MPLPSCSALDWAPDALVRGVIGSGFGALNAADVFWLPSVTRCLQPGDDRWNRLLFGGQQGAPSACRHGAARGVVLAGHHHARSLAAPSWPAARKQGLHRLPLVWTGHHPAVREVLQGDGPATTLLGSCRSIVSPICSSPPASWSPPPPRLRQFCWVADPAGPALSNVAAGAPLLAGVRPAPRLSRPTGRP